MPHLKKHLVLFFALLGTLILPLLAQADDEADWTVILLMAARYESMQERLSWTGSSDRVNVLVLHDQDGEGMVAYRMLGNPDSGEPVGQCCPGDDPTCCDHEDLDLPAMDISPSDYIFSPGVLDKFFTHVATNYPAQHYMVSSRGQMTGPTFMSHNGGGGVTIEEFRQSLATFGQVAGGKIDVVNIGLCLGGLVDWAYELREVSDFFVASANWTNAPVASRWRFYLWTRELILNPETTPRQLANYMPDAFALQTPECAAADHNCNNTGLGWDEPWTVGAYDLSQFDTLVQQQEELVCLLLGNYLNYEQSLNRAVQQSVAYGWGCQADYCRPDLKHLVTNIAGEIDSGRVDTAAENLLQTLESAVVNHHFQPGFFGDHSRLMGLSTLFVDQYMITEYGDDFGTYQFDSKWRLLLEAGEGLQRATITSLTVAPQSVTLGVGDTIELEASAISQEYGPLCAVRVDWDKRLLLDVAELTSNTNPVTLKGIYPGQGTLTAKVGDATVDISVTVTGTTGHQPGGKKKVTPPTEKSGCTVSPVDTDPYWVWVLVLGLLLGVGRRTKW